MMLNRILLIGGLAGSLLNFRGPLIKALSDAGHEVHVAAPSLIEDAELCADLKSLGATPHDIFLQRTGLNPFSDLRSLWQLFSLMRSIRPDTVLAYTAKPVIWGGIAAHFFKDLRFFALITGLGYAFTGEASGKRAVTRRLAHTLYQAGLRRASGIMFQNPDDLADFKNRGLIPGNLTPIIVNGSGVDTELFAEVPFPGGRIKFLLIARLLGDKGIREYAEAAQCLLANGVAAEFHLVGPLDANPDGLSEELVMSWQQAGILQWHGAVLDVRPAISGAHVYVLPSYREGTPRSVLEAMSMSRPIVTTDAPGCRETVLDGVNGFLVPVRDAGALAVAMKKFIDSPDLVIQMGAQSRKIAEAKYDVHRVNATVITAMGL